ncbi:hypothetical protein ACFIOY_31880 [Bradyrhizobium sp. TZ2]
MVQHQSDRASVTAAELAAYAHELHRGAIGRPFPSSETFSVDFAYKFLNGRSRMYARKSVVRLQSGQITLFVNFTICSVLSGSVFHYDYDALCRVEHRPPFFARGGSPRRGSVRAFLCFTPSTTLFPSTSLIAEAARKAAGRYSKSVEIDAEFLDLARNTDEAHSLRTATFIRDKYGKHPPDLVITLGSNALPFVIKHRDLLPDVPVVFASISPQTYAAMRLPPKMTGIITAFDLADSFARGAAPAGC